MLKHKMHQLSMYILWCFQFILYEYFVFLRLARKERDLRAAEGRLKQYETEIGELKARNEALGFDANRKTDENVVSDQSKIERGYKMTFYTRSLNIV